MLTRNAIKNKLDELLVSCDNPSIKDLPETTRLQEDMGMTSISMLYMVITIEEEFNISFDDVSIKDFVTVSDILDYIEKFMG